MDKKFKGFSLMEMIISIAAISIVSGFIIQMFLASSKLNVNAKNLDFGVITAMNDIETFKSVKSIDEYIKILSNDKSNIEKKENRVLVTKKFDKNWDSIGVNGQNENFIMTIDIYKEEDGIKTYKKISSNSKTIFDETAIYKINVEVQNISTGKKVVSLSTYKYFDTSF